MHSLLGTFPVIFYPNLQASKAIQKPCPIFGLHF